MEEVEVERGSLDRLAGVLPPDRAARLRANAARARASFGDRVVWHVNATAHGGGVAEMLQTLLAYGKGAGIDNRWLVLEGDRKFFEITKRLHNLLHGSPGDGGPLGQAEHEHYRAVLATNLAQLQRRVASGDIVLIHDPQTAGLGEGLRRKGARVVWRCHVGRDLPNEHTRVGWDFLRPYLEDAERLIFTRRVYAPDWVDDSRLIVIPPSIDPFAPKNVPLDPDKVAAVLSRAGLVADGDADAPVAFTRRDGSQGSVRPHRLIGGVLLDAAPPGLRVPLVVQVSRWDRLKDMAGVMRGFAQAVAEDGVGEAHLVLAGPAVDGVSDDPEGAGILAECSQQWHLLPSEIRRRVHLASLPMDDADENAILVNALQRHAAVVVQKSLVEGFGLTVTEPMWKARPVVASRVGGIQDQITHGKDGMLLDDPGDLDAFAGLLRQVLADEKLAGRLGEAAHARVQDEYLGDRHLNQYVDLFASLVGDGTAEDGEGSQGAEPSTLEQRR